MALKKSQKSLKKWTSQNWRTKSGKPSTQGKSATERDTFLLLRLNLCRIKSTLLLQEKNVLILKKAKKPVNNLKRSQERRDLTGNKNFTGYLLFARLRLNAILSVLYRENGYGTN